MNFKPIAKVNNVENEWSVGDYTISDLENIISFMKEQHKLYAYQSNNS